MPQRVPGNGDPWGPLPHGCAPTRCRKRGLTVNAELGAVPALVEHDEHDGEEEGGEDSQSHGHRDLGIEGMVGMGPGSCCKAKDSTLLPAPAAEVVTNLLGKLRHKGGQAAAFILSHPTSPCFWFAFTLRTALLSHRYPCAPCPKSQSTAFQPSPHPKCVLIRCLHGALQRAVPGACVRRGHRVSVGRGHILTPAQSLLPHQGASPSRHN